MAKPGGKKKAANGYKLAEIIPPGEILEDFRKQKWRLGASVGQGGFGRIYSAQHADTKSSSYPYVIKIEPHANGPLFVEMNFYMRNAKPEDVNAFKQQKKLKSFGMPIFLGSGSHEFNGEKYRFIVTEHFGTDLWKIFLEHDEIFPGSTVFKIGTQILDVLEYIHGRGYVHADIKGANILMGTSKETKNKQVYLVDFGLATKFTNEKEFKANPKKAHDGTIEYLSRDAHQGVSTRRGDLEILAYNIIQWLGCKLPWMDLLKNPKDVHESKDKYMKEIPKFIKLCFGKRTPPGPIVDYLNYITSMDFNTDPDYAYIRKVFISGIDSGDSLDKPFCFTVNKSTPVKTKKEKKVKSPVKTKSTKNKTEKEKSPAEEEKENDLVSPQKVSSNDEPEINLTPRRGRVRNVINYREDSDDERKKSKTKKGKNAPKSSPKENLHITGDSLEGYTDQMKEVMKKMKSKSSKKVKGYLQNSDDDMCELVEEQGTSKKNKNASRMKSDEIDLDEDILEKDTLNVKNVRKHKTVDVDSSNDGTNGYTEEMKEIAAKKQKITKRGKNTKKNNSDNDNGMDGYTDEMKEVVAKRKTAKRNKNVMVDNVNSDEEMDGYTEEMKEVALKSQISKKKKSGKEDSSNNSNITKRRKVVPIEEINGYLSE